MREVGAITAEPGGPVPDVAVPSTRGRPMSPAEFRGKKNVVLIFYPGSGGRHRELAGDEEEARAFRDVMKNLRDLDAVVLGVSRQTTDAQKAFAESNDLNFPLLSDVEGRLGSSLGVPEIHDGPRVYWKRVSFVADRHGVLRRVFPKVDPTHHAEEVIAALLDVQRRE